MREAPMNAEMGDTGDAISEDETVSISDDNDDDRRTSLDEATAIHQVTIGGTQRSSSSKYLLSSS